MAKADMSGIPVAIHSGRQLAAGSVLPAILTAVSVGSIVLLGALRIVDGPPVAQAVVQIVLVTAFSALAFVEYRAAVAIVLLEIACLGASGLWTSLPGGLSGRQVLHAIVFVRALGILLADWRAGRGIRLGRYGWHALALALILPLVWMPLGLLNGNAPSDVFGDGNAHLFFAFILVVIALIAQGLGPWLRRWLLIACAANAVVTGLMIAITITNVVPLYDTLRPIVILDLVMGGSVGYMPNGAYRLYLGSGIYLQVGIALTVWQLLQRPRNPWLWALYALFLVDVTATYTRGFWLGTALAVAAVLVIGARSVRRPAAIVAGTIVLFVAASSIGALVSFSLPGYILERTSTSLPLGEDDPGPRDPSEEVSGDTSGEDVAGAVSSQVRVVQARVLTTHILESPAIGHGFGSIAPDYPYEQIYSYELAYLDLAYKAGIIGLLLFLSLPIRLLYDAVRIRFGTRSAPRPATGTSRHEMAVVIAVVGSMLITSATNPYILAAFGLLPVLVSVAWLEPLDR
jgi:hypothetical protein